MKIVPYQNLDAIPAAEIQACKKGKWSDWKRSFIVETDKNVNIVVLNFFQRAARLIQAIFHINYFKSIFGEKNVKVISPNKYVEKQEESLPSTIHEKAQETFLKQEPQTAETQRGEEAIEASTQTPPSKTEQSTPNLAKTFKPKKPEKQVSSSTTVQTPISSQIEVKKMDAKELNRILNRGLVHKATIDPSTFENLVPKFKEYAADKEIQEKVHGNKSNEYIDITYQSFGYGLDDLTIKLFIRYLVLKGEIFGFSQTRDPNAFRIELNDPGTRKRNVNGFNSQIIRAEELISLDNFMKQHELPLLTDYDSTQQKNISTIHNIVEKALGDKFLEQVEQRNGILLPLKYTNLVGDGTKALDDLVKMGTIYAWNYISRGESVGFILTKDDVMPDVETSVYRAWRDRDFIEKEEAFKAANTIQLHNKTEIVSSFSRPEHGLDLDRLVLELNKRTEPGVFIWTGKSYSAAVVQALKDNGYIHGFKKNGPMGNSFEVYVTAEDEKFSQLS